MERALKMTRRTRVFQVRMLTMAIMKKTLLSDHEIRRMRLKGGAWNCKGEKSHFRS